MNSDNLNLVETLNALKRKGATGNEILVAIANERNRGTITSGQADTIAKMVMVPDINETSPTMSALATKYWSSTDPKRVR